MKARLKRKNIITVSIILSFILNIPISAYASEMIGKREKRLPKNVYIDEIDVGRKTFKEVESFIDEKVKTAENKEIIIKFSYNGDTQVHKFKLKELGYCTNEYEIKREISAILYNDLNPIEKVKDYVDIRIHSRKFEFINSLQYAKFCHALQVFDNSKLPKPINAEYRYKNGQIQIIPEQMGYELDIKSLYEELLKKINEEQKEFVLKVKEDNPKITKTILEKQGIREKISSFTTGFTSYNKPRNTNMRLAAGIIDGTVIAPGEIFSFNKIVGERTKERGFQEAGVFINGNLDTGLGGGICQVSTTLYNAALIADLEIVERSNHSLIVHYVPLSRDAAVSYGHKDFKFKNNSNHYIYIHANITETSITFDLFGTKGNKWVELKAETLKNIEIPIKYVDDSTMRLGKTFIEKVGQEGYESRLVKRVYENGKLVKDEVVSRDRYQASPTIIRRGTRR
ncbi:MAG: VanW family protein [Clostridium sp.]|nr:VanW family protein [Clostridium sp.]